MAERLASYDYRALGRQLRPRLEADGRGWRACAAEMGVTATDLSRVMAGQAVAAHKAIAMCDWLQLDLRALYEPGAAAAERACFTGAPLKQPPGQPADGRRAMTVRRGQWMQTFTGCQFWPLDPRPDEIHIEDIAHALSMQCRYAGHCIRFYSVAEHSVLLARHVSPENRLWALLHDASEAYLVDVPRPIKADLDNYREIESRVMAAVCQRFGLPPDMPDEVHEADNRIIGDERANLSSCVAEWSDPPAPLGIEPAYLSPASAESLFLDAFGRLADG